MKAKQTLRPMRNPEKQPTKPTASDPTRGPIVDDLFVPIPFDPVPVPDVLKPEPTEPTDNNCCCPPPPCADDSGEPAEPAPEVITEGIYEAKFDWLGAGIVSDTFTNLNSHNEFFGIGWISLYVPQQSNPGNAVRVPALNAAAYVDASQDRVYEIPRDRTIDLKLGETESIMNAPMRYRIEATDFGYDSLEELERYAYFRFTFEVKEKDETLWVNHDDNLGKELATAPLSTGGIAPKPSGFGSLGSTGDPGVLIFREDGSDATVTFSWRKL